MTAVIISLLLSPLFIFAITAFLIVALIKRQNSLQQRQKDIEKLASDHGWQYIPESQKIVTGGSLANNPTQNRVTGTLRVSHNEFLFYDQLLQINDVTVSLTTIVVTIPNTNLQLVVCSDQNTDPNGTRYLSFAGDQKYEAEGDFNKYFTIFLPRGTASNALSLLSPEVLMNLKENFHVNDIEILDNHIYIYSYAQIPQSSIVDYLDKVDKLMLDIDIMKKQSSETTRAAAVSAGTSVASRRLKVSYSKYITQALSLLMVLIFGWNLLFNTSATDTIFDMFAKMKFFIVCFVLFNLFLAYKMRRDKIG